MIERRVRSAIDTNIFVSAILRPDSTPALALQRAVIHDVVLYSAETLLELQEVLNRPKFAALRSPASVKELLDSLRDWGELVVPTVPISECRDAADNMFLKVALAGSADVIMTGDSDLLSLHPWRGIAVLSPADYLAL